MFIFKSTILLLIFAALMQLTGCAHNAVASHMVYQPTNEIKLTNQQLKNAIAVQHTMGGQETDPLGSSQIDNQGFQTALITSLKNAGLYHQLNGSKFHLTARLISLDQPVMGINMTVKAQVKYQLIDASTDKAVLNKLIR